MATTVAVLEAALHADTKRFDAAMGKSESKMQKLGKVAGIAGLAIAGGLAVAFKVGFDELSAMQKATAQTEAVLKSTGMAANVTADHVRELAESVSSYSGMDDEAVQAGENLLLTFHKIENQAGATNDVFDQTVAVTADLAQAMGMDMTQAALQVGKALNDPAKGFSRLQRIGVSFTASQEKLIKKLSASGDVMGAQKVILAELNKEFGGSAKAFGETMPGKLKIAQESFRNLSAELIIGLLPAITKVADMGLRFADFLRENPKLAKGMVIGLAALSAALLTASAAQIALNLAVLANPYVAAAVGVLALAAAMVVLYKRFAFVRRHWQLLLLAFGLGPVIVATVVKAIIRHWDSIKPVLESVKAKAVAVFNTIRTVVTNSLNAARAAINALRSVAVPVFNAIRSAVQAVAGPILALIGYIQTLIGWISRIPDIPFGGGSAPQVYGRDGGRGAEGAIVTRPTWSLMGEAGPEALIPLHKMPGASPLPALGGGGTTIVLNVPSSALVVDAGKLVRYLDDARRTYGRRGGA